MTGMPVVRRKFVPAKWFYKGRKPTTRTVLVIHDMEVRDGALTAEAVANVFKTGKAKASAHFTIDLDSVCQCVSVLDTAFAAPGANNDGIQFELAGFARQTRQEWQKDEALLDQAAVAVAEVIVYLKQVHKRIVPVQRMTKTQLLNKSQSGLAGHRDVNDAFHLSTHTDPGSNFPWDIFLRKVAAQVKLLDKPGFTPRFI